MALVIFPFGLSRWAGGRLNVGCVRSLSHGINWYDDPTSPTEGAESQSVVSVKCRESGRMRAVGVTGYRVHDRSEPRITLLGVGARVALAVDAAAFALASAVLWGMLPVSLKKGFERGGSTVQATMLIILVTLVGASAA